jgi:hypothetical protein
VAIKAAVVGIQRTWLEMVAVRCWFALRTHARDMRRDRRWQQQCLEMVSAALQADPELAEAAFRCVARWRLMLVGKAMGGWAAYTRLSAHRRNVAVASTALAHLTLLRKCTSAWQEVVCHERLLRRVRNEISAERCAAFDASPAAIVAPAGFASHSTWTGLINVASSTQRNKPGHRVPTPREVGGQTSPESTFPVKSPPLLPPRGIDLLAAGQGAYTTPATSRSVASRTAVGAQHMAHVAFPSWHDYECE